MLRQAHIDSPRREAMLLIAASLQKAVSNLLLMDKTTLVDPIPAHIFFTRRADREPFAYIVQEQGFWALDLKVSPATLIPRADSESLIEILLKYFSDRQYPYHLLDLGTGTGCLLLAALYEYPNAVGVGVDRIEHATFLARDNAKLCGLDHRASFITGYWADSLQGKFDVILSNPPYIRKKELLELMPEVKEYEPLSALDGGLDGLDAYRYICAQAHNLLTDKGILIFELGIEQEKQVNEIALSHGLSVVQKQQDLNGCIRALVLSRSSL